ncbi:MAG: methyltransferase domain-containing protein [Proteobacteria bacterium]|nr:methyltransferase domain-containing protein [Pseudomonadota bacterium]MBU1389500.1 methyltransferase domain-containing protein [Pseudomonadota bacterium]MBU1541320.1 methyltransferase domain-containing protein [Pseudomonadota bacterium]MBU2429159.1 methyltransferase domain-containing protein [Pseudomonadota bacterium]MBU2481734.1 methyltransferase domain-containing protein [Pseudomonadota bacterium]
MGILTFRRYFLDQVLEKIEFSGKVLDIGGVRENQRGRFRPPMGNVKSWQYLNIDASTSPDYCCSAENIPIKDSELDMILMAEVMEHLENPGMVLSECHRILKADGKIVITTPFMYMIHAHPHDYQRWTLEGIQREMIRAGFAVKDIQPMGGLFAAVYDLVRGGLVLASTNSRKLSNRAIVKFVLPIFFQLFLLLDKKYDYKRNWITTGYCAIGKKKILK